MYCVIRLTDAYAISCLFIAFISVHVAGGMIAIEASMRGLKTTTKASSSKPKQVEATPVSTPTKAKKASKSEEPTNTSSSKPSKKRKTEVEPLVEEKKPKKKKSKKD